jgi:hypothetical protein
VIREVMQRQIVLNWLSSSTTAEIPRAPGPCGSRMDSALSRTMSIFVEDRNGRKGVRSLGFLTPAPMALERRLRRLAREAGNWSQRMNRRFFPNRCLIRLSWRIVRAIDVFPIPPAPMRAMGVRFLARPTIFSISSSRPKQALGGGGGDSPSVLRANVSY